MTILKLKMCFASKSSKHFLISIFFPPIEGRHPSPCPTPARYFMPRTMMTYFLVKNVFLSIFIYNIALQNTDFGVLQKSSKRFLISIFFTSGQGTPPPCPRRGSRGRARVPPPPPHFLGKKQEGQKPHTQKKNQYRTTTKQDTG